MSPTERFFLQTLPTLIARELPKFRCLHGTLAFSCGGQKFTICLGNAGAPIVPGFLRAADVKIWFFRDAFDRFLAGEEVRGRSNVMVQGDLEVLERFGRLLLPSQSPLSVRFAA